MILVVDNYLWPATSKGDIKNCSPEQFYHQAGFKVSYKKIEAWHKTDEQVSEAVANIPVPKTLNVDRFEFYVDYLLPTP